MNKKWNPDVKRMTDLELLSYKGKNPLVTAELERRKKERIKSDSKLKLV